jgi:hypothetical protein
MSRFLFGSSDSNLPIRLGCLVNAPNDGFADRADILPDPADIALPGSVLMLM